MTYYYKSDVVQTGVGATVAASISWDAAAGTSVYTDTTDVYNTAGNEVIGQTLEAVVQTTASGDRLPSRTCTAQFTFTAPTVAHYTYAINHVSYSCVSPATPVWCKHLYVILDNTFNFQEQKKQVFSIGTVAAYSAKCIHSLEVRR